jgi:hypothetical protein
LLVLGVAGVNIGYITHVYTIMKTGNFLSCGIGLEVMVVSSKWRTRLGIPIWHRSLLGPNCNKRKIYVVVGMRTILIWEHLKAELQREVKKLDVFDVSDA